MKKLQKKTSGIGKHGHEVGRPHSTPVKGKIAVNGKNLVNFNPTQKNVERLVKKEILSKLPADHVKGLKIKVGGNNDNAYYKPNVKTIVIGKKVFKERVQLGHKLSGKKSVVTEIVNSFGLKKGTYGLAHSQQVVFHEVGHHVIDQNHPIVKILKKSKRKIYTESYRSHLNGRSEPPKHEISTEAIELKQEKLAEKYRLHMNRKLKLKGIR